MQSKPGRSISEAKGDSIKTIQRTSKITGVGLWLLLICLNGVGCGGGPDPVTSNSGKATKAAVGSSLNLDEETSKKTGAGSSRLVLQPLGLQLAALQAAVTTTGSIGPLTETVSLPCKTGTATGTVTGGGTFTADSSGNLSNLDLTVDSSMTFNGCSPPDLPTTTDVNEADYVFSGTLSGPGTITGSAREISYVSKMVGTLEMTKTCNGTLTFDVKVSGSGPPSSPSCAGSGTVIGIVCDTQVSCRISGDCGNIGLRGTGCN